MHEADARVESRKAGDPLLDAGHADQDHAYVTVVKDRARLFQAVHLKPVGFVDYDERGGVGDLLLLRLLRLVRLEIDGIDCRPIAGSLLASP